MTNGFSEIGAYFRTFEGRAMDGYFRGPVFNSFYFRSALSTMLMDEALGGYLIFLRWAIMSPLVRAWLILSMIFLAVALFRAISHHAQMQSIVASLPQAQIPDELLRIFARSAYSGLSLLFGTSAALLFCFATELKYIATIADAVGPLMLK
jgi:hypothetical protein